MDNMQEKRFALVTGGARGIGAAVVRCFIREGWRVAFTYHTSKEAARCLAAETGATALRADVSDPACSAALIAQAHALGGPIDALVNNAGISLHRLALDTGDEEYRRVMDTNFYSAFALTRAVLPDMLEKRRGAIVNIGSIWGHTGGACESVYAASKAALSAFTRAVALEVASAGIRVNAVAPGFIDTDMNHIYEGEARKALLEEIPMRRAGSPEEIAEVVRFLTSEAASYITGTTLHVDGGWYA